MPVSVSYNFTVFDENMSRVNTDSISNGGIASSKVEAVQYVCASRNPNFVCYTARLELAYAKVN
jgi:hypothetical protein